MNKPAPSDEQQQACRAYVYQALSAMYYAPTAEFARLLEKLPETLQQSYPELAPYAQDLLSEFQGQPEDLTDLTLEHTRLFVGPNTLVAAPYGSVYLEEGRKIMGDTTMKALEHYRALGLKANNEIKQPPDFIATELEFMYFLIHCHLQTGEEEFLVRQAAFLDQHPGMWVEAFCEAIDSGTDADFYRLLAAATRTFIVADQDYLRQLRLDEE